MHLIHEPLIIFHDVEVNICITASNANKIGVQFSKNNVGVKVNTTYHIYINMYTINKRLRFDNRVKRVYNTYHIAMVY